MTTPHPEHPPIERRGVTQQPEMETFTVALPSWPVHMGDNPLVRGTDRIKRFVLAFAVVASVLGAPIAAAIGTAIYDSRRHIYAEEAARHPSLAATVSGNPVKPDMRRNKINREVQWIWAGREHTGALRVPPTVKPGDTVQISVDRSGSIVATPPSADRAALEAVVVAALIWLTVVAVSITIVAGVRTLHHRLLDAAWQRDIDNLLGGPGRHPSA